ncbi:MAG: 4Fe-4S dicluster domain-containing protein [Candidatus Hydrogenedentota bacterium]|nr:MAG: 4Fe-4S dicluster domain-containing protein [Candidatus Hydrogenedentota bacterium]
MPTKEIVEDQLDSKLLEEVEDKAHTKVSSCFQCLKCSSGCPIAYEMDYLPAQIIRMVNLGMLDEVLKSRTIWVCASCETCTTRCPNDIDIAHVMDTLREMALHSGKAESEEDLRRFHESFLSAIKTWGRVHELQMIGTYKLKTRRFMEDADIGMAMFKRGKIKLIPESIKGRKAVRKLFKKT